MSSAPLVDDSSKRRSFVSAAVHAAFDWLTVGLIVGFVIIVTLTLNPPHREIFLDRDFSLNHTTKPSTVPSLENTVVSYGVPLLVLSSVSFLKHRSLNTGYLHDLVLTAAATGAVVALFTVCIKISVGRPRPNFLYEWSKLDGKVPNEERFSYVSGHTSTAFSGATFFALEASDLANLFRGRNNSDNEDEIFFPRLRLAQFVVIVVLPYAWAWFVGVSRILDHKHNYSDVNGGVVVGTGVAVLTHALFRPSRV